MVGGIQHASPEPGNNLLPWSLHWIRIVVDSFSDDDMLVSRFKGWRQGNRAEYILGS